MGQQPPAAIQSARAKVEGDLPATLKVRLKTAALDDAVLASSVRRPMYVAPSAIAYGHAEYSPLPADLSFYAGLAERGSAASKAQLDALEARFESGPSVYMALDTTQGEVLVGPVLAKKLHLEGGKGSLAALPPFRLGSVLFSGVQARLVAAEGLPGESVDGVLPLSLFEGLGIRWEPSAERLTLCAAGSSPQASQAPGAFSVAAEWPNGALCLGAVLQEKASGHLLLNPAQPHSAIDLDAARRADINVRPRGEVVRNEIIKGGLAEEVRLRLGTAQVAIRSARVSDLAQYLPAGSLGILGRDVFGLFGYYIEPGASTVLLIPPRKAESRKP